MPISFFSFGSFASLLCLVVFSCKGFQSMHKGMFVEHANFPNSALTVSARVQMEETDGALFPVRRIFDATAGHMETNKTGL